MPSNSYPPVPNTVRADLIYEIQDGVGGIVICENSIYIRNTPTVRDTAYLVGVATRVAASWQLNLKPKFRTGDKLAKVKVTDLHTTLHSSVEVNVATSGTGGAFPTEALATCAVIQLLGDAGGIPKRSYIRHPALNEDWTSTNFIDASAADGLLASYEAFVAGIPGMILPGSLDAVVIVSVFNPGGSFLTGDLYKDTGDTNTLGMITVRPKVGRSISRLS